MIAESEQMSSQKNKKKEQYPPFLIVRQVDT